MKKLGPSIAVLMLCAASHAGSGICGATSPVSGYTFDFYGDGEYLETICKDTHWIDGFTVTQSLWSVLCSRSANYDGSGEYVHGPFPQGVWFTSLDSNNAGWRIGGNPASTYYFELIRTKHWDTTGTYTYAVYDVGYSGSAGPFGMGNPSDMRHVNLLSQFLSSYADFRTGGYYQVHVFIQQNGVSGYSPKYEWWGSPFQLSYKVGGWDLAAFTRAGLDATIGDKASPEEAVPGFGGSGGGTTTSGSTSGTTTSGSTTSGTTGTTSGGTDTGGSSGGGGGDHDQQWYEQLGTAMFVPNQGSVDAVRQKFAAMRQWGPFAALDDLSNVNSVQARSDILPGASVSVPVFEMVNGNVPYWHFTNRSDLVVPLNPRPVGTLHPMIRQILGFLVYVSFLGGLVKWLMPRQVV